MEGRGTARARAAGGLAALALVLCALFAAPQVAAAAQVKAGAAVVDASWHVGASAGQYASDGTPLDPLHDNDPTTHSTRRAPSYGIQSRLQARALVVEGPDGKRAALVKNDLYIPQDLLYRRIAQILESKPDLRIGRHNLTMTISHDHSSPYYSSPSWGVWAFQDVFDVRFFDYYAKQQAAAVEKAARHLVPVRVGASLNYFNKAHRHSFGGAVADDGTPAGYPKDDTDHDITVIRFDDISDRAHPRPLATLVNFGVHPEDLNGNDLISGDFVAPLQRIIDRTTGGVTIFNQNAVGTSEPERTEYHSVHDRVEFSHKEYAQSEWEAHLMANAALDAWRDIARRTPHDSRRFIPFTTSFPVAMEDRWFPGPVSHPYPGVSNCRTNAALAGDPRLPVVGLPDCTGVQSGIRDLADIAGVSAPPLPELAPIDPGLSTEDFARAGIPLPGNYSAPSYTGLEEDVSVHLQALRLGDILLTFCSCEQWADQSRNIKTRTDRTQGNEYLGYDWTRAVQQPTPDVPKPKPRPHCVHNANNTWTCPNPSAQRYLGKITENLPPLSDHAIQRMKAQVTNPANGWNDVSNAPYAEEESDQTSLIKGNYTHDDDSQSAKLGYRLTVTIAMANDYNGYIASYREYERGDHYRKALTGWGPHSSDYMATRLVGMGRHLHGGPDLPPEVGQDKVLLDLALNDQRATNLGQVGDGIVKAYEAALPDDGTPIAPVAEPKDIERFSAAFFSWNGGSNFTDNPTVVVQRRVNGRWVDFADQSGEIPVTIKYPQGTDLPSYELGSFRWRWTAHFEAFGSSFDTGRGRSTPAGSYRFVVDGLYRRGHRPTSYRIVSRTFQVRPWSGITVNDVRIDRNGNLSYRVGPRHSFAVDAASFNGKSFPAVKAEVGPIDYPDTYASPARFIQNERAVMRDPLDPANTRKFEWYCLTCSFRPWADAGDAKSGLVTIVRPGTAAVGRAFRRVRATRRGDRWYARTALCRGEAAFVAASDVRDAFGDVNGSASAHVAGTRACSSGGQQRGTTRRPSTRHRRHPRSPSFTG
jgi:neutral/alkaline ceramidase-like enzyme